jgi:hypothetical protein
MCRDQLRRKKCDSRWINAAPHFNLFRNSQWGQACSQQSSFRIVAYLLSAYSQFRKGGTSVNSTKRLDQHNGRNFSPAEWPANDLACVQVASSKGGIARSCVRSSEQIALTRCSHWSDIGSARGCELLAQTSVMGARDLPASWGSICGLAPARSLENLDIFMQAIY